MVQVPSLWGAQKTFHERFCALEYNEDAHWAVEIQPLSPKRAPVLPAGKVCETNVEALRCFLTAGCVCGGSTSVGKGGVGGVPTPP